MTSVYIPRALPAFNLRKSLIRVYVIEKVMQKRRVGRKQEKKNKLNESFADGCQMSVTMVTEARHRVASRETRTGGASQLLFRSRIFTISNFLVICILLSIVIFSSNNDGLSKFFLEVSTFSVSILVGKMFGQI